MGQSQSLQQTSTTAVDKNNEDQGSAPRKLSSSSQRNVQLLAIKPRNESAMFADSIRCRRRSSLINMILGAAAGGPRFCEDFAHSVDVCSLSSQFSFGIEFAPGGLQCGSVSSLAFEANGDNSSLKTALDADATPTQTTTCTSQMQAGQRRRRSSLSDVMHAAKDAAVDAASRRDQFQHRSSLTSALASIDLMASFDKHCTLIDGKHIQPLVATPSPLTRQNATRPPLRKNKHSINQQPDQIDSSDVWPPVLYGGGGRFNGGGGCLSRISSELSLYTKKSAIGGGGHPRPATNKETNKTTLDKSATYEHASLASGPGSNGANGINIRNPLNETKLIIMLQVCLPFILAGFGNMSAGLVLNRVAQWQAFKAMPIFFILLPPFVGLKGNIEMTLASRTSTLVNLGLLSTWNQIKRTYAANLILTIVQSIGLSTFAAIISIMCNISIGASLSQIQTQSSSLTSFSAANNVDGVGVFDSIDNSLASSTSSSSSLSSKTLNPLSISSVSLDELLLLVLATSLCAGIVLAILSSFVISLSLILAHYLQVNPDNLSTLTAALYGDVSCILIFGLVAELMFSIRHYQAMLWPALTIFVCLCLWPVLVWASYKLKETHDIVLASILPMVISIIISMGSGSILSLFVARYPRIALYQPVVNGFGANLIAVQASRVSTWLSFWQLYRKIDWTVGDLIKRPVRLIFWSFCGSSPNSVAAKLLVCILIPAQTLYFVIIWFLSPSNYITITWQFYTIYIALCLVQVILLLLICEPFMTILATKFVDPPDTYGISILMALADLIGTICLMLAFVFLANIGDVNAQ